MADPIIEEVQTEELVEETIILDQESPFEFVEEEMTLHKALAKAQSEYPLIEKGDANLFFKSKYAGLPSILEVVLPILHRNSLYLTQIPIVEEDRIGVETIFTHVETGESLKGKLTVKLDKDTPQGAGSAITYTRRYMIVAMLGLNIDTDDDGNAAEVKPPKAITKMDINDDQDLM